MPTNTSRASYDTFITEQWPSRNWGGMHQLQMSVGAGTQRFAFLYFSGMPAHGSTVLSATLRVWLRGSNWAGGPHTLTVKRVTGSWKESKLTWSSSGSSQLATATNAASASVTAGVDGQEVDIDVSAILADIAAGQAWYGLRLEVSTTNTGHLDLYSSESTITAQRPQLTVNWSRPPGAPIDLAPQGGAAVSISKPVLKWVFKDPDGDAQADYQVQIASSSATAADGSFTSPGFDTGWVSDSDTQFDTSKGVARTASVTTTSASATITTTAATFDSGDVGASITGTGIPAGATITAVASATSATISASATASGTVTATITRTYAGISAGGTQYWIVRTQDVNGLASSWSVPAEFTQAAKGTLAISNPPNGGYVEETTPPITSTLTGQAQDAIAYMLEEQQSDGSYKQVWSSGRFTASAADGTAFSYDVPAGKLTKNGTNYRLTVWSYDTVDREATPGDPVYVAAQSVFTFNRSTVPAAVGSLTVTPQGPGVQLAFSRSTQPDYFALRVDNVLVFDRLDPVALNTGTGTYGLLFYGATPNESHTFEVEAVVTDAGVLKHSESNPTVTLTPGVLAMWLVDDSEAPYATNAAPHVVRIDGQDSQDFTIGETSNAYYPIGRRDPVTIVDAIRGLEGTVSGTITDDSNGYVDAFRWAKSPDQAVRTWRLIYANTNMSVQLGSAHLTPQPFGGEQVYAVSVDVVQVGDFQ